MIWFVAAWSWAGLLFMVKLMGLFECDRLKAGYFVVLVLYLLGSLTAAVFATVMAFKGVLL
jgi:hypothetical protein